MDKPTKKRQNYNAEVIEALVSEYGFTAQFIRQCIRKDRKSITADTIRKKYYEMVRPTMKAVDQFKNNPL